MGSRVIQTLTYLPKMVEQRMYTNRSVNCEPTGKVSPTVSAVSAHLEQITVITIIMTFLLLVLIPKQRSYIMSLKEKIARKHPRSQKAAVCSDVSTDGWMDNRMGGWSKNLDE